MCAALSCYLIPVTWHLFDYHNKYRAIFRQICAEKTLASHGQGWDIHPPFHFPP